MRTEREIEKKSDEADSAAIEASKLHGMTYEQGVQAALTWVLELDDDIKCPIKGE